MTTLVAFLVTLAVLIVVHELGHYAVARLAGVKVLRFSVGFGPVLARHCDRHGTEWVLSAFPLGGYVKMVDEREGVVAPEDLPKAFNRQPIWKRSAIVAAGPAANFLLAITLYWGLYVTGVPALKPMLGEPPAGTAAQMAGISRGETVLAVEGEEVESWEDLHWALLRHGLDKERLTLETRDEAGHLYLRRLDLSRLAQEERETRLAQAAGLVRFLPPLPPVFGAVLPESHAARGGVRAGDRVLAVDGMRIDEWEQLVERIRSAPGRTLFFEIDRDGRRYRLRVTPEPTEEAGRVIGRIGAAPRFDPEILRPLQVHVRYDPGAAFRHALEKTWSLSRFSVEMFARMLLGQASLENIAGPVTIADLAGQSAKSGMASFVAFLALISISLGVLNLLPIPLLDGGHLLYHLVEFLTGRPVSERLQAIGQKVGIALLGALMFLALFNDLQRLLAQ